MPEITLEHVRLAAEWAQKASEPLALDGLNRRYDQGNWDCGTSCCMWGAASIISGNGPASSGPSAEWAATDARHGVAAGLMRSSNSTPEQMLRFLTGADLTGASLRGADLTGADLTGASLTGADLTGADLTGADLRGADLRDADLRDASLRGADLTGANLRGANLRGASLRGADLTGADLTGADLTDANLRGAIIWLGNRRLALP